MANPSSDLKQLAKRWVDEIWNERRVDAIDELAHADAVIHEATVGPGTVGIAEYKELARALYAAVPDLHFAFDEAIVEGDRVAFRATVTGTHTGPGLGIEPSGRAFRINGMALGHYRDGKLVEGWNNFDLLSLFEQVGALKRPG